MAKTVKDNIRNFCIVAHIDHGKSTLADRLMEFTSTVSERDMEEQLLDSMDLERERGITIKLTPVRMAYKAKDGKEYIFNLIDTPGHVDFNYEVSRSLAACEGAILVVDASQGVEAQTLANMHLAVEQNLEIVPVINKIDLPSTNLPKVYRQLEEIVCIPKEEAILCSAKAGIGIEDVLEAIVTRVPAPKVLEDDNHLRALVFDSVYDAYRGVVSYVRLVSGSVSRGMKVKLFATDETYEVKEVGIFTPKMQATDELHTGDVGYIIANMKSAADVKIGDTYTNLADKAWPPSVPLDIEAYQDGISLAWGDSWYLEETTPEDEAFGEDVEPGATVQCNAIFMLRGDSPVDVVVEAPNVEMRVGVTYDIAN